MMGLHWKTDFGLRQSETTKDLFHVVTVGYDCVSRDFFTSKS